MKGIYFKLSLISIIYLTFIIILFYVNPKFGDNIPTYLYIITIFPFLAIVLLILPFLSGVYLIDLKRIKFTLKNKHWIMYSILVAYGLFFYLGFIYKLITKTLE